MNHDATILAPAKVGTIATTVYLSGESWWTTVTFPSPPLGMNISFDVFTDERGITTHATDDATRVHGPATVMWFFNTFPPFITNVTR